MMFMNNWLNKTGVILLLFITVTGCDLIKMKDEPKVEENKPNPVARVGDQFLYPSDLEGIATEGMTREDSTERTMRFVNNWVRKQLLIQEAATKIEFDEADIERKILDYRYSLMGYEYQSYYINQNLNKEVSDEEITQYYNENIDNFLLKQNIIRGRFVKLPVGAPKVEKVKVLINSNKPKSIEELNSYALSFAANYQFLWTFYYFSKFFAIHSIF